MENIVYTVKKLKTIASFIKNTKRENNSNNEEKQKKQMSNNNFDKSEIIYD